MISTRQTRQSNDKTQGQSNETVNEHSGNPAVRGVGVSYLPSSTGLKYDFSVLPVFPAALVIQKKSSVNEPGGLYEQEANHNAELVLQMGETDRSPNHETSTTSGKEKGNGGQEHLKISHVASDAEGTNMPSVVYKPLISQGQPLLPETRHLMEQRFGHDFSRVRVHADSDSFNAAQSANALAYTSSNDIVFGAGQYSPRTLRGQRLLAHELTHVVQQRLATPQNKSISQFLSNGSRSPLLQFDLAQPTPAPSAVAAESTPQQARSAILFNQSRFADPYVFAVIRDVLGISRFPAIVDDEFVHAIAQWQSENNLPADGRLTPATITTIVAELRAEGKLVPALMQDAVRVELEAAFTYDEQLNFDRQTIRILQRIVGAPTTGIWDDRTIQGIIRFQRSHSQNPDGMVGPNTLRVFIETLIAAAQFDDTIHIVINAFHFPTTNLASITFDASVTTADALTTGTIATGQPQTIRVGPSTFHYDYAHMIRVIGHELQHVQQRTGATPIANQHVREFLSYAWEALSTGTPALSAADRVSHANIAIGHWNQAPAADRAPQQAVRDRLDQLIAAHGVGNF